MKNDELRMKNWIWLVGYNSRGGCEAALFYNKKVNLFYTNDKLTCRPNPSSKIRNRVDNWISIFPFSTLEI